MTDQTQVRVALEKACVAAGSKTDFARQHGFTPNQVSKWLWGRQPCPPRLCEILGVEYPKPPPRKVPAIASMGDGYDWTDERIDELRRRWLAGEPTAQIGREMHCGKNAAVGKAHRIGLSRPSPVKARAPNEKRPRRRASPLYSKPTLAPLKALAAPHLVHPAPSPIVQRVPISRGCCQWIDGDVRRKDWKFCDAPTTFNDRNGVMVSSSWCPEHQARVFKPATSSALAHGLAA